MHWPCSITLNQRKTRLNGNQSSEANCDVTTSGVQWVLGQPPGAWNPQQECYIWTTVRYLGTTDSVNKVLKE